MYGSSLMIETERPRLLSSRPMLAAVMPLPSEEVTPPVTKTYFAIASRPSCRGKSASFGERASTDANATLGKLVYLNRGPSRHPNCRHWFLTLADAAQH